MPPRRFSGRTVQNPLKTKSENRSWVGCVKTHTDLLLLNPISTDCHGALIIYEHPAITYLTLYVATTAAAAACISP